MSWSAVAGAAVGVVGSYLASNSAGDAADQQAGASQDAIGEQRRQFDLTRQDFAPYREIGTNALRTLYGQINEQPTAAEVMAQPGYQFGLQQGQQAIDRRTAAAGGRISGASLKAAARYGTDYATTGYNAEYQRRQDRLNRLAALSGIGQSATGSSAAAGSAAAGNISGIIQSQGDANAAATLARGNIWGNTANQLGALYMRNRQQQTPAASFGSNLDGFYGGTGTSGD